MTPLVQLARKLLLMVVHCANAHDRPRVRKEESMGMGTYLSLAGQH